MIQHCGFPLLNSTVSAQFTVCYTLQPNLAGPVVHKPTATELLVEMFKKQQIGQDGSPSESTQKKIINEES